ncbi:hypothetical protein [Dyadobacter diqingensis]|uniref:hypothetical protein n=1 Tax=Dyadobacter diqingensis TaxID=2938121 RepID=UPI0020C19A76|nr:hypothetical protein [Dyadobacter diqingensis]
MKISKIIAIVLMSVVFTSCKKSGKDISPVKNEKTGTMSVEVNGTVWTGTCGAVDAQIGAGINVTILSNNSPQKDLISMTIVGYTGSGDYSTNFKTDSGLTLVYNGLNYKYDKKSTDPLVVKITESSLPAAPLGLERLPVSSVVHSKMLKEENQSFLPRENSRLLTFCRRAIFNQNSRGTFRGRGIIPVLPKWHQLIAGAVKYAG